MARSILTKEPHRRYNPLTDTWVLVSPHRTRRPWQGKTESIPEEKRPAYDPACYLCPGNPRAGGQRNPQYRRIYVFENDFAALLTKRKRGAVTPPPLLYVEKEAGICRVLCFSPRHDLSLGQMSVAEILRVVEAWIAQHRELARYRFISHVQVFENRGEMMGCSNPHPHCQIWAQESIPQEARKELSTQAIYYERTGHCLLCEYLELELSRRERLVESNRDFVAVVPFWATWPFELLVMSRRHVGSLPELSPGERRSLATLLRRTISRYDNLFRIEFPYSMGWHQTPTDGRIRPAAHLHAHFYPPLLRSATVKKFMVGYEMLCEPQRDTTPESSAERLRAQPSVRFSEM